MIAPYPLIDPRRAKKLVAELEQLAAVFVPAFRGVTAKDSVNRAVVEIAGRLAGQVTQRMDKSPRRDAIAFFHTLDVPQEAPRSALATLIFTLSDKRAKLVHAPARIQVAASTPDGEEVIFETISALNLTPARLDYLAAVDAREDRIEQPPPQFFQLALAQPPTPYEVVTLANAGNTLQISPAIGLEPGDVIGIDNQVYRIKEAKEGLVTLHEQDRLEKAVEAETEVRKVTRFDVFQQRNLQRHLFYVGHKELLNLEQPSTIRLRITPPDATNRLMNQGLTFELYGTKEGEKESSWHKFDEEAITMGRGDILLFKKWYGIVDEIKIHEKKNRWLKVQLDERINDNQASDVRITSFSLQVESGEGIVNSVSSQFGFCSDQIQPTIAEDPKNGCIPCEVGIQEGSLTVKQAFHNSTPLPLSTRFFPFGLEPLRFDTFYLSAPEALSKKGAKVAVGINLVDATPAVLTMALANSTTKQTYVIGVNGLLQALELGDNGKLNRWQELGHPEKLPEDDVGRDDVNTLRLDPSRSPLALRITLAKQEIFDLVVVADQGNRFWVTKVSKKKDGADKFIHSEWMVIPPLSLPDGFNITDCVLLPYPVFGESTESLSFSTKFIDPSVIPYFFFVFPSAFFLAVTGQGVYSLGITTTGVPFSKWHKSSPSNNGSLPSFSSEDFPEAVPRLVSILSTEWPSPPVNSPLGLVLLDADGKLWRGLWEWDFEGGNVTWVLLTPTNDSVLTSFEVKPVAANFDNNGFCVFAATKEKRALFALIAKKDDLSDLEFFYPDQIPNQDPHTEFIVRAGTELLCDPSYLDFNDTRPIALAFGQSDDQRLPIAIWLGNELADLYYPQDGAPGGKPSGMFVPVPDQSPVIYINGRRETLYRTAATPNVFENMAFELFDTVITSSDSMSDFLELLDTNDDMESKVIPLSNQLVIEQESKCAYAVNRTEGLQESLKYKLHKKYPTAFEGVMEGDNGEEVSSMKLRLNDEDSVTTEDSILTIENNIYRIIEINENLIATLDASPAEVGQAVDYYPSVLLTENPEDINLDQLATLVKLTDLTRQLPITMTKIEFEGAIPVTQSIVLSDHKFGNIWVLLESAWETTPEDEDSVARVFLKLGIGNWSAESFVRTEQNPELSWEYFDGNGWQILEQGFNDTTNHLAVSGRVCFCVPNDITPTDIAGQENFWIRARLVGGDYGRAKYVVNTTTPDVNNPQNTTQTVTVDTSELRAPEILAIEACFKMTNATSPQQVLTENNRAVLDQTQANVTKSAQFELFEGAAEIDAELKTDEHSRALYLGFTKPYDVNPLTLFIDADEPVDAGEQLESFELLFEVLELDQRWRRVAADDRTDGFQHRGMVNLFIDIIPQGARLFGRDRFWLRVRPGKNGAQWKPLLNGIYINAGEAEQAKSVKQEILGASSGEPNQRFFLSVTPVISNSLELRVRETLSEDERLELEQAADVERDSAQPESDRAAKPVITTYADIPGRWVLWQQVNSFVDQDGDARVYQLDPASGEVRFGDDQQGKIPPAGQDAVRAIGYQNGGGEQGNVAAFKIEGLKSSVESVESVTNPIPAAGGVDALDVDTLITTAPDRLRHRQQALTTVDIEALAVAWSSEIVRARCLTPDQPSDPITVFIARRTGERCPKASRVERDALTRYLLEQGWGALGERSIRVLNPDYVHLSVAVKILAESPETVAAVEKEARERLLKLLHPIDGGPDGSGWPFGRRIWTSDLFRVLADVPGLDRVEDNIELKPDSLGNFPASSLICADADEIEVKVVADSGESPS